MHFVLGLDIQTTDISRKSVINTYIWSTILNSYKRARRLGNFLIIKIDTDQDWKNIFTKLTEYSNAQPETIQFIMTPPMSGGTYNGILNKGDWDFINEITADK